MKVTVQELLNVLVGREATEVVEIDANGIHVEPTTKVNLLNQSFQGCSVNVTPEARKPRTVVKVGNSNLGWKAGDIATLIDLHLREVPESRIAETLGRTVKGIQCQLCKLRKKGVLTKRGQLATNTIAGV